MTTPVSPGRTGACGKVADRRLIEPFWFDADALEALAARHRDSYRDAAPFAHAVLEGLVPEDVLYRVLAEFPAPGRAAWFAYDSPSERKLEFTDESSMGFFTRHLLSQFNSSVFIAFLEKLTGIGGLVPDPHFSGGGLHQIEPGGFLKVHADFNRHPRLGLERRLNVLVYLNPEWKEDYGGHLELWNHDMTGCEARFLPELGRCVVFSTDSTSYHGHPDPLRCPLGMTRKSLALYYYTAERPNGADGANGHNTLFRARPDEAWQADSPGRPGLARRILPPGAFEAREALRDPARRRALAGRLLPPPVVAGLRRARRRWS